ncbi:hypothetical protein F5884DRAFT_858217 [Xylogone sp. PMI_703]|nr:hypothetical protein F5884DRAFT_858217 [Xylogone sp. PMI_703]
MPLAKAPNYTLLSQGEELTPREQRHARLWKWLVSSTFAVLIILALLVNRSMEEVQVALHAYTAGNDACPQYPALGNRSDAELKFRDDVMRELSSEGFLEKSVKNMQGAVQIPTESFDGMGTVGQEPRFDIFEELHEYLEKTFPLVYSKLSVTKVNTYGIFIEWKGRNSSLKPYLFMGHQDVVPVPQDTVSRWTYPPYSGHYDGEYLWGRGTLDCKTVLIGVLESFEVLLEKGYEPERTMLAAFGFDEEISGWQGAKFLSQHIQDLKGKDSLDLIIDEGGGGVGQFYGANFVFPSVAEKGYFDVRIEVETNGGHSSVPPDHTGIGILSRIISTLEDNPYEPNLTPVNPYFTALQCGAEHSPDMSSWLRKTIKAALKSPKTAKEVANYLAKEDINARYFMQTSQAVDVINGGVKVNSLPEKAHAVINHRIAVESNTTDVRTKYKFIIEKEILSRYPLALDAWGDISGNTSETSAGKIVLSDFDIPLESSPVSPYDSHAYKIFSGTLKQVYGDDYIVSPSVMNGNTDTKFFWELSKNIYRFTPFRVDGRGINAHTVDERIEMKQHVEGVRLYAQLILNGDIPDSINFGLGTLDS